MSTSDRDVMDDDREGQGRSSAEESSLEAAVERGDDLEDGDDEDADGEAPGSTGPVGTGVEGADDALEADREHDGEDGLDDGFGSYVDELGEDDSAAAEQGNRDQDEMVSEGDDVREVDELDGDDLDVDAIGGIDEADGNGEYAGDDDMAGDDSFDGDDEPGIS